MQSVKGKPFYVDHQNSHAWQAGRDVIMTKTPTPNTTLTTINLLQRAGKLARRNLLLGLGGLYGAKGLRSEQPFAAIANPVLPPDIFDCQPSPKDETVSDLVNCCPPEPTIIDFVPPPTTCLRVRQPAHAVTFEYIAKYNKATQLMRDLPPSDPRNFMQQANVHCAYCDGAYHQAGLTENIPFVVHDSWLFFPFHRWYLYFYERILGSLIGDPTFALPFWNWDHPDGMQIPYMYTDQLSALYDKKRSTAHQPPAIVDLNYSRGKDPLPPKKQVEENLCIMHKSMVSGAKHPLLFFGSPYSEGTSGGTWAGSITRQDMGVFYSAGRDPIFFAHHSNVDRMWSLWRDTIDGPRRKDILNTDFLDAGFVFYDENARLVRVKIEDCLDTEKLGYVYHTVDLPWRHKKSTPHRSKSARLGVLRNPNVEQVALTDFPLALIGSAVTVVVTRPKTARGKAEKEKEEEVLVIEGIDFDRKLPVKFDVYVNDEDEPGPTSSEFAGSFGNLPHTIKPGRDSHKVSLKLGITDLLEEIEADDDDDIKITLVPKGNYKFTIDGIKIELIS